MYRHLSTALVLLFAFTMSMAQVIPTNEWVSFYSVGNTTFDEELIPVGATIDAYDPDGVKCGTFTVTNTGSYGVMPVYRDDATTSTVDEGADPGDVITFKINGYTAMALGPDAATWTTNGAILAVDLQGSTNQAPSLVRPISDVLMDEDDPEMVLADLDTVFTDPDGDAVAYTANVSDLAVSFSIDEDNLISISLSPDWFGSETLWITATDAVSGGSITDTVAIVVNPVNDAPVVSTAIADVTMNEDDPDSVLVDLHLVFSDIDGDLLSFSGISDTAAVEGIVDADSNLVISFASDWNGTAILIFTATDGSSSAVSDTFNLVVNAINDIPTVSFPLTDVAVDEDADDTSIALDGSFTDVDIATNNDRLTLSVGNNNISLLTATLDGSTLNLSYLADQNGSAEIYVTATDESFASVTDTLVVEVNSVNDAPRSFSLATPEDGTVVQVLTPTLSWQVAQEVDAFDMVSYTLYYGSSIPDLMDVPDLADTVYTFTENLMDNTTYYWKVVASDLSGSVTENTGGYTSFTVNTSNDLPEYFELLYPVWDEMVTNLQPEFLWEASSDPDDGTIVMRSTGKDRKTDQLSGVDNSVMVITGYDFYLGTDAALTDVVPVEVIGTSYTPDTDLTENQVYYWVVSAIDDSGGVTFSDTASFWSNSENSAPEPLTLLTPVMASETDLTPTFSWTLTTDADLNDTLNYTLMFGTDPFSLMSVNMGAESQYVPEEPLMDNTEYIWQVIATDIQGATYTTEFFSFFVNSENDVPVEFTLVGPDSGSYLANADVMLVWTPSTDLEGDAIAYRVLFGETIETLEAIDTVGVNYYELNDLADGYYVWQVEAMDEMDGTLASPIWGFLINVNNDPPEPFSLIYPTAEMLLTDQQPMFTWEASSSGDAGDHTSYRLELGTNAEDMAVVYEGDSTHFTPELALEDNAIYYWQVTAIDMAYATTINEGGYQNFILNTVNDGPSMAELISPDSVIVLSDTPVFNWTASTDIDPNDSLTYEVHWWTDLTEMDSIITTETQASPATPLADDNLEYTWNVITMDAHGGIAHSEEKTFWVDFMPEVPASFALLGPDSASAGNGTRPELTWAEAIDPDPFDAVHYSIAIATDSLMENVVFEEVAHIETWMPETDLDNDTRYYWQVTAIDEDSLTTESSIWTFDVGYVATDEFAQLPDEFTLKQNYPNPFNPSTTIRYGLPEDTNVSLVIYDVRGQIVQTIASKHQSAGWYDIVWNGQTMDGKTISTGIYFARLVAGEYSQVIKMLYLK